MEFRPITNEEFIKFAMLNALMYQEIAPDINEYQATNTLTALVSSNKNFLGLGAYEDDELVGFSHGINISAKTYEFTGLYMLPTFRKHISGLIEYSFAYIKDLGYIKCEVDSTNPNMSSIMEKYDASVKYTRYTKEL